MAIINEEHDIILDEDISGIGGYKFATEVRIMNYGSSLYREIHNGKTVRFVEEVDDLETVVYRNPDTRNLDRVALPGTAWLLFNKVYQPLRQRKDEEPHLDALGKFIDNAWMRKFYHGIDENELMINGNRDDIDLLLDEGYLNRESYGSISILFPVKLPGYE